MNKQVVVTGIGVISSAGIGTSAFWEAIKSGHSGIADINFENYPNYVPKENEVRQAGLMLPFLPEEYFSNKDIDTFDSSSLMILKAVDESLQDSGINYSDKQIDVILGTAIGFRPPYKRLMHSLKAYSKGDNDLLPQPHYYPSFTSEYLNQTPIEAIFKKYSLKGTGMSISSICASGSTSICLGTELVKSGKADAVVCGAFDFFHPLQNRVFSHYKMLSPNSCKPFDRSRKGFQLGEGIGVVIVESLESAKKRSANIYAEIAGYGMGNDAFHFVIPSPSGNEYSQSIDTAIIDSAINPEEIDYWCPIGRGGRDSDAQEVRGVERVFKNQAQKLHVNSIVPVIGYCLGANSIFNFIGTLLQMKNKTLFPIKNLSQPDKRFKPNFIQHTMTDYNINNALVCGYGFTGVNTAIVLRNGRNLEKQDARK